MKGKSKSEGKDGQASKQGGEHKTLLSLWPHVLFCCVDDVSCFVLCCIVLSCVVQCCIVKHSAV